MYYYLLLSLMICAVSPISASQEICLSDGGESPLYTSRTSSDEMVGEFKRKRAEKEEEQIAPNRPRCPFIGTFDMSLPAEVFRQQALHHLARQQQLVASCVLVQEHRGDAAHCFNQELAPIADTTLLPVRPRAGIDFAKLPGLTLAQMTRCLNNVSMQQEITELHIAHLDLETIPGPVYTLVELGVLNLAGNKLGVAQHFSATVDFTGLRKLRELNLSYNQIKALPKKAFVSDALKVLFLDGNWLEEVDSVFLPAAVQALVLRNNQLQSMPRLANKNQLKIVDVSNNQISRFDPRMLPSGMQFIDATHNCIETVTENDLEGWEMGDSGQILLGENRLKKLPVKLCAVIGLQYADFSQNAITDMPTLRNCFPNGGVIDLRANGDIESGQYLKVIDARQAQQKTNALRSREKKISMLTASTMDTQYANELREKWPKPQITYQVVGSGEHPLS